MWHEKRFIFNPNKIQVNCTCCNKAMYLPKSKANKYITKARRSIIYNSMEESPAKK